MIPCAVCKQTAHGIMMDSRLIFRPRLYVNGMTDYIRSSALLDLTSLPVEQESGKSDSSRSPRFVEAGKAGSKVKEIAARRNSIEECSKKNS